MLCIHCDGELTSADEGFGKINECRECASDIQKYAGRMVWDHKTAPVLEIHASSDSLIASEKNQTGIRLVHAAQGRSRRRETETGNEFIAIPYAGNSPKGDSLLRQILAKLNVPVVEVRDGKGLTYTSLLGSELSRAANLLVSGRSLDELAEQFKRKRAEMAVAYLKYVASPTTKAIFWQDASGFYIKPEVKTPKRKEYKPHLDIETLHELGYRQTRF